MPPQDNIPSSKCPPGGAEQGGPSDTSWAFGSCLHKCSRVWGGSSAPLFCNSGHRLKQCRDPRASGTCRTDDRTSDFMTRLGAFKHLRLYRPKPPVLAFSVMCAPSMKHLGGSTKSGACTLPHRFGVAARTECGTPLADTHEDG